MSPIPQAAADRVLLERILRESAVDRRPPSASYMEYLTNLLQALTGWLANHARPLAGMLSSDVARIVLWLVVAGIFVALALLLVRRVRAVRRRPSPAPDATRRPDVPERDHSGWRREIDARLLRGDMAAALEALWWWLARALCGPRAEGSWTSRELLAQAGRGDLRPLTNTLDRMVYGAGAPNADQVRRLLKHLEESLA